MDRRSNLATGDGGSDGDRRDSGDERRLGGTLRSRLAPETRSRLSGSLVAVVTLCLLVAAAGGYLTYAGYGEPETETETTTVGSWQVDTGFEHSGVVREETSIFNAGQRLANRPVYFSRITPTLEGAYVVGHDGDAETAAGTIELRLLVRSVETDGETTTVHWQESERLAATEVRDLQPGEKQQIEFAVDTTAVAERVDEIRSELGATPGRTEVAIVADTVIHAAVEGDRHVDEREDRLQVDISTSVTERQDDTQTVSGVYRPTVSLAGPTTYETVRTVEVPVEPSPVTRVGGPALLVFGLLGTLVVVVFRSVGALDLTAAERERLTFENERAENDEWISRGTPSVENDRQVTLDSLDGLVGVAVDSNRRVIESDGSLPRYVVVVDDVTYVFQPPEVPTEPADSPRVEETASAPVDPDDESDFERAPDAASTDDRAETDRRGPLVEQSDD